MIEKKEELVFDTTGLDDRELASYQDGIIDCLEALGIEWEYDETAEDLSSYRVKLKNQKED